MISALLLLAAVTTPHFGLAIQPAEVQGPALSHATLTVVNTGTQTEVLKLSAVQLRAVGHEGWVTGGPATFATITPTTLTLTPGQSGKVSVHVNAKDAYRHDVAIEASQAGGMTGQASVSAAVAARYVVTPDGATAPSEGALPAQTTITASHSSKWLVPGLVAAFVALMTGLAFALRRRKPKSTPPPLLAPWSER